MSGIFPLSLLKYMRYGWNFEEVFDILLDSEADF
jgi:hypothetical protein